MEENFILPRVGHIGFLNVLPLNYSYANGFADGIKLVSSVPKIVNEMIQRDELDVSLISSIEYARQSSRLVLLPSLCVRADNEVTSILLVSRKPIEELDGEKIFITAKSATAHCLLKIILREGYNLNPSYEIRDLQLTENLVPEEATAALFIGDDALQIYLHKPKNFLLFDLGAQWHKLTGRQMVYAVWAARKKFAEDSPELLQKIYEKIFLGMQEGIKNKSAAINSVLHKKFFSFAELDNYLGNVIKWDLTDAGLDALKIFYQAAHKINLLDEIPEIKFAKLNGN